MEFLQGDIRRFLIDSIPSRFHNLSPAEFESFITYLFRKDGYEIEENAPKGDLAHILIARKDDQKLVIKPLRLPADQLVGLSEIQNATAARTFYESDQSWIITTSGFSEQARDLAEETDIELWDWDALYQALSDLFFEGKSHFDFIDQSLPATSVEITPEIKLKAKWKPEEGISAEWYNLDLVISNPTERNLYLHLDLPALIDTNRNQVSAEKWAENEFVAGMIYAGASVRTNALFKASRLGERPPSGKVMLTCHERTTPPTVYHVSAKIKGSACYVVTYCYTRQSDEYALMTKFRDEVLDKNIAGKFFIRTYYVLSPVLVHLASQSSFVDNMLRKFTHVVVRKLAARDFSKMKSQKDG